MIGLPGQSAEAACSDLERALQFAPPHLSVYQLTLEPNTVFHKYPPTLPDEQTASAIEHAVEQFLAKAGYEHYEVSAWSQRGCASRHNLNYWTFGDYVGIGAGAHAKISLPDRIVREERYRLPESYLAHAARGQFIASARTLGRGDLVFEFMLNALRLRGGFAPALFPQRTGLGLATIQPLLREAQARGLLEQDCQRIAPTERGIRFLNDLQAMFLEPAAAAR